jgi:hypothetical protein
VSLPAELISAVLDGTNDNFDLSKE